MWIQEQAFPHGLPIVVFEFRGLNPGGIELCQIGDHSYFPAVRLPSAEHWGQMPGRPPASFSGAPPKSGILPSFSNVGARGQLLLLAGGRAVRFGFTPV